MVQLAVSESARLLPYVMTSRKAIKQYLKVGVYLLSPCPWNLISVANPRFACNCGHPGRIVSASLLS